MENAENSDWNDIQACLDGDQQAFERIILRNQNQIARLMWRFSRDSAVCEALVQDVFVEAYLSLKSFKGKAPFINWLKKIATRVGYRYWKEKDKRKKFLSLQDFDFIEKDDENSFDSKKASKVLHSLLELLPRADRLVLTLMYFENCGTEEIAERTGWSRPAVKMRVMRARNKIKRIAERENLLEKIEWIQ